MNQAFWRKSALVLHPRLRYCGYVYNNHIQTYSVRFRDYVPHRGRWLQADPSGYPDGSNRQSYMRGNPIGWVDPFGLQTGPAFQGGMSADPVQFGSGGSTVTGGGSFGTSMGVPGRDKELGGPGYRLPPAFEDEAFQLALGRGAPRLTPEEYDDLYGGGWWWAWWNSDDDLAVRGRGFFKTLTGLLGIIFGGPPGWVLGGDQVQAGLRQMWTGDQTETLAHEGLVAIVGEDAANKIELLFFFYNIGSAVRGLVLHIDDVVRASSRYGRASDELGDALGGPCFVTGTIVLASYGQGRIETIQPGDNVWAFNCETKSWQLSKVKEVMSHEYAGDIVTIEIESSDGTREIIRATGNHPFWVAQGEKLTCRPVTSELPATEAKPSDAGRWTEARELRSGDTFLTATNTVSKVVAVTSCIERTRVYNLSVTSLCTYAVGKCSVLVHNKAAINPNGRPSLYDDRVFRRAQEDPRFHGFPMSFDDLIISTGTRTQVSPNYVMYRLAGNINGKDGFYEIGIRIGEDGSQVIDHRFFNPMME